MARSALSELEEIPDLRESRALFMRELGPRELPEAAAVLSRGMRDNPLHVAAFGADAEHRERVLGRLFRVVLDEALPKGTVLGAFRGNRLLGVCAMARPGRCQPTPGERNRLVSAVFRENSVASGLRAIWWSRAWGRRDPKVPHWHFGPLGVERDLQGQGVGSALLRAFTSLMDERHDTAFLETDKDVNVPLYERFGFRVTAEARVLGVPSWFMRRDPARGE